MRRTASTLAFCAALALFGAPARAQTIVAQPPIPPPMLLPVLSVDAPIFFQWMPVSPGLQYRVHVTGGPRGVQATQLIAIRYELQISRSAGFTSDVLYDRVVDATTLLFDNGGSNDSSFTRNPEATYGLSDGTYFWRVRALFAGPASRYSEPAQFALRRGVTSPGFNDAGITALHAAGHPIVGKTTLIVAHVASLGSYDISNRIVTFTANGAVIGIARIAELKRGKGIDVSAAWTPTDGPLAAISAQIDGADQDNRNNTITQTLFVASAKPVLTSLTGTLVAQPDGYAIGDASGNVLAVLRSAPGKIDYARWAGMRVEAEGALSASGTDLMLAVTALRKAPPAP
ncbi:MAG: hypothetical protein NVSMB64_10010 [Candidatus Velthaea sp.]